MATTSLPRLLKARDLAEQMGISKWTVYDLTKRGLPHVRFGRVIRYDPDAVRAWLAEGGTSGEAA